MYIALWTKSLPCIRFLCAVPSGKCVNVVSPGLCSSSSQKSFSVQADAEPDRPVVVPPFDRVDVRLALRVALEAGVVGAIGSSRAGLTIVARTGRATWSLPGPWHFSQPTFHSVTALGPDVVVDRMAAVAERPGRTPAVFGRIERHPPIGADCDVVGAPLAMRDVPLRRQRKVVVADLGEVALLPLAAVDEGDIVPRERHKRVRTAEVRDDGVGVVFRDRARRWPCACASSGRKSVRDSARTRPSQCRSRPQVRPTERPQRYSPTSSGRRRTARPSSPSATPRGSPSRCVVMRSSRPTILPPIGRAAPLTCRLMLRLKLHSTNDFRTQRPAKRLDDRTLATALVCDIARLCGHRHATRRRASRTSGECRLVRSIAPHGCVEIATLGRPAPARRRNHRERCVSYSRDAGASITEFVRNDSALIFTIYRIARDNDVLDRIYSDL